MSNIIGLIMDFEDGNLNDDEVISLFQGLANTGQLWSLQGSYQRTAMALAEDGYITL